MMNMTDVIFQLKNQLIRKGLSTARGFKGCSVAEIRELEQFYGYRLPLIYKDFLEEMGHQAGDYLQGTDIFYKDVFSLRSALEKLLQQDGQPFVLEPTFFVFCGHQGYIFYFFDADEDGIDPPIYGYKEGNGQMERLYSSFSSFLLDI